MIIIRQAEKTDIPAIREIYNSITEEGRAFPGEKLFSPEEFDEYLDHYTCCYTALIDDEVVGGYILKPNNVDRAGHTANGTYFVREDMRGKGIGLELGKHSLTAAKELGFTAMQFNAVVEPNKASIAIWKKLGFTEVGMIPDGFRYADEGYVNMFIFHKKL